jgi:hypothetical protein
LDSGTLWLALALVFIFEGLFPFAAPGAWRRMFTQLLQLSDGQIRFFGVISISTGLMLIWWLVP